MSEEFENVALFLRGLGLPSTLIRHENGAFRKRSSNRENLKTPALCLVWTENILKTVLHLVSHVISLPEFSSNTNQNDRLLVCFQISPRCVDGKRKTFSE